MTQTSFKKLPAPLEMKMTVKLSKTNRQLCQDCSSIIYILLSFLRLDNRCSMFVLMDLKIEQIEKIEKNSGG
jgi:serine phosphatase RsbU (regulator of sigma subunit)